MKWTALFAAAMLFWAACLPVAAETPPDPLLSSGVVEFDFEAQLDAAGVDSLMDALPEDAEQLLYDTGIDGVDVKKLLALTPKEFFSAVWSLTLTRLQLPLRVFSVVLGIVLLGAMLDCVKTSLWEGSLSGVFAAISTVCVAASVVPPIADCIASTASSIRACSEFILAFIPVFSSVVTVSGQPVTATAYTAFLFMACQVVAQIASGVLVPLMGVYLAFCICGSLAPSLDIGAVAQMIRKAVTWTLVLVMTLFVSLLSLQTLVASGSDSLVSKTAKFLIGSFVPVVGSALSDAFMATQGYMKLLKTSVGVFGILAALMTFLPIFLQTGAWYLAVNVAAAVGEMLGVKQTAGLLRSVSATLGVLIAVIACFALLVIISTSLVLIVSMGV